MSRGVGRRLGSDAVLLWLWCSLAAVALIRPLAWEPPYARDVALKGKKERKKERKNRRETKEGHYLMVKRFLQEEDITSQYLCL